MSASNWSFWTCAPISTSQSFRYPFTRAKIDASCHGLTSAGKLSPLRGVVAVGETTATVGIANSLVSAAAVCRCRNWGTKPPTNAIRSIAPPDIRIKRCLWRARTGPVLCSSELTLSVGVDVLMYRGMCLGCGNGLLEGRSEEHTSEL